MSEIDKLLENIENLESKISTSGINISKYLLPDSEVVKKIMYIRNPNMSLDDIKLMIDGISSSDDSLFENIIGVSQLILNGDTELKRSQIRKTINDVKSNLANSNIPLPDLNFMYEEAKDLKNMIIEKATDFSRKIQELIQDITFSGIAISQAIPGSIQLIIAPLAPVPSFNISGMITMLMNITLTLNSLKSKIDDVKNLFTHFSKITIVCSDENANVLASILNKLYESLENTISPFIERVDSFIQAVSAAIESILDPNEEGKKVKIITKELRKIKYLPNNDFTDVDEDDVDVVNNILDEWIVVDKTSRKRAVSRKKESKDSLNNVLKSIERLKNIKNEISEITKINNSETKPSELTIYDVEFSDGKVIKGLTKEEIDGYIKNYNVVFLPNL